MRGDQTKDCLGGFVERYIPLFIAEIKHYSLTNADEMKARLLQLDLCYSVEEVALKAIAAPSVAPKKAPDQFQRQTMAKFKYASDEEESKN